MLKLFEPRPGTLIVTLANTPFDGSKTNLTLFQLCRNNFYHAKVYHVTKSSWNLVKGITSIHKTLVNFIKLKLSNFEKQ